MNKAFITGAVISKGFEDKPALRFNETRTVVSFKVGYRVYDKQAENEHRWINLSVKAFKPLLERIEKMGLKAGSYINFEGKLDEDVWDDKGVTKRTPVIVLDEIEFSGGNSKKQDGNAATAPSEPAGKEPATQPDSEGSGEFTGFQPFGGNNDLY